MQSIVSGDVDRHRGACVKPSARSHATPSPLLQNVPIGATLFRPGEERTLYCVETGALSHFIVWPNGRHEVVEFAFPGDIIGLGYLDAHVSSAHAMVDSVVTIITQGDLDRALLTDDVLGLRLTSAIEREFDYLREKAIQRANGLPAARFASYLVAIARLEGRDGGGPRLILDRDASPHAADLLGMDLDTMSAALAQLHTRGLVAVTGGGLIITDIAALERFADGEENFG